MNSLQRAIECKHPGIKADSDGKWMQRCGQCREWIPAADGGALLSPLQEMYSDPKFQAKYRKALQLEASRLRIQAAELLRIADEIDPPA